MNLPNQTHEIYTMDEPHASVFKKISNNDVKYNPFFAYKHWTVYSGSATSSALPLNAIYSDINILPALGTELTYNDSANIDNSLQTLAYHSINNLIYKRNAEPYNTIGGNNLNYTKKFLYQSASILSFPGVRIGEGIKPKSYTFTVPNIDSAALVLKSDKYGNIYDTAIDTSSFATSVMFYEGFNEYFDINRIPYSYQNISFVPGVPTTNGYTLPVGYAAKFTGNGFMHTGTQINGFYDRQHDYAISFYISASNITATNQLILGLISQSNATQYPFKIELDTASKIKFTAASNDLLKTSITSSTAVTAWTHIICQKSGSMMQLYLNNVLNASAVCGAFIIPNNALSQSGQINNNSPLYIGGFNTTSSNLTGVLDEVRIFNKTIPSASIASLNNRRYSDGTFLQTNNVGTLFHHDGLAIVSSPHYKYNNILQSHYTASYRSTKRLYELNVLARISKGDFNLSTNPSVLADNNETYQSFVTSSGFAPYITTIGLYDGSGRLLAIGKLGQAIQKRDDVDMNFVIRIDLDAPVSWRL